MNGITVFRTMEHSGFSDTDTDKLKNLGLELSYKNDIPTLLGLSSKYDVGYFIGTQWLTEGVNALIVEPKIENIDYLTMFLECLKNPRTTSTVSDIYSIDFTKDPIPLPANTFELTPLIIIHFLTLLKKIVQKGLKRDYIWIEENLKSKIKGKLLINQNIKINILKKRMDRNICRYQDYSIDCTENRILKKTLNFVFSYIKNHHNSHAEIVNLYNYIHPAFYGVSDSVTLSDLKRITTNSLYKEYNETLKVAEMILKRFSYSIHNSEDNKEEKFPPFYIDMSLLFEMYVLTKLDKAYGKDILAKALGSGRTELDYLHISQKTVIDAKYKEVYCNDKWDKDNIRQLSGYARDYEVIKQLDIDITQPIPHLDCLIIYPDMDNGNQEIEVDKIKNKTIKQFVQFYKYGITLPIKNNNNK
ncbi:hypothetical protein EW093_00845 [Thiospirochaeta perfilievii]|uniref:Restriction endonuclease n=1 Tax=Thiospirochaeta perfilievii TaxID=252967 RepID=A0A5C1Q8E1_9SPIO|nr:hypothetical protein [Thiospirochaeta perfilievii]QEN03310.1 hypothetical protein EW093_00845 [Thiospirochaeta perfilievii]